MRSVDEHARYASARTRLTFLLADTVNRSHTIARICGAPA
jgi:hypothetical protein